MNYPDEIWNSIYESKDPKKVQRYDSCIGGDELHFFTAICISTLSFTIKTVECIGYQQPIQECHVPGFLISYPRIQVITTDRARIRNILYLKF